MNKPDIDEIVHYLSTKFNKIFCDRDFVCCVSEDLQLVLNNKNKCCVVVFPVLGPIYLKAVRYQARIYDLAVFGLTSGKHKSIAVCHKQHLIKNNTEVAESKEVMAETCSLRRKRPAMQLYVPPAQRRSRIQKVELPTKSDHVLVTSDKNTHRKTKSCNHEVNETKSFCWSLRDFVDHLPCATYNCLYWKYELTKGKQVIYNDHNNCVFQKYIKFGNNSQILNKIYIYSPDFQTKHLYLLNGCSLNWLPTLNAKSFNHNECANSMTYPVFSFKEDLLPLEDSISDKRKSILLLDYTSSTGYVEEFHLCNSYKVLCNESNSDHDIIIDLTVFNLGHYFLIQCSSDIEFSSICSEEHDVLQCYLNKKSTPPVNPNKTNQNNSNNITGSLIKTSVIKTTDMIKNSINSRKEKPTEDKTIPLEKKLTKTTKKNEHDQEKEIMRKAKENINRKTRPIMKYVDDDNNDTLKIGKNDNVNNWEDLFDDEGQLQEELFTEIAQKVGNEVTIVKAAEDYSAYSTKPMEELEHVVELYNFPATLETHDIIQAFSELNSESMYLKWVDDTHALLVLGSLSQAQKAVELDNPLIKARPMSAASGISLAVAYKSDLKPAMKRPQTNLQTARRLITSHLGAKTRISKEQSAKEKEDLKMAREMKKLAKQKERDAWEGKIRSST